MIVDIRSRAFTASTWFGYVLGSHERSLFLGNPERAWQLFTELGPRTCRVHYGQCDFWPLVSAQEPTSDTFLQTLLGVSGCDRLVVYNGGTGRFVAEIDSGQHGDLVVVEIIRDVVERYASWKRRNDGTVLEAVRGPLGQAGGTATSPSAARMRHVQLRHEVLAADASAVTAAASDITGLAFDDSALAYWRHEQHPAHGNGVTHATCRHFQNPEANSTPLAPVYLRYLADVEAGAAPRFSDDRPGLEISDYERFVLDHFVGQYNESQGYVRPAFTDAQRLAHVDRMEAELRSEGVQ